jgi:hypothetical protein
MPIIATGASHSIFLAPVDCDLGRKKPKVAIDLVAVVIFIRAKCLQLAHLSREVWQINTVESVTLALGCFENLYPSSLGRSSSLCG